MPEYSIRDCGQESVKVFRKRERSHSLAHAWRTPSGFWIVSVTGLKMDVTPNRKSAKDYLRKYFK